MSSKYKGGAFSRSELMNRLKHVVRLSFKKSQNYIDALRNAEQANDGKYPSRAKKVYKCAMCRNYYPLALTKEGKRTTLIHVDHKTPVTNVTDVDDLPKFVEQQFVTPDKLQVLCGYPKRHFEFEGKPSCHYLKTQKERKERKK